MYEPSLRLSAVETSKRQHPEGIGAKYRMDSKSGAVVPKLYPESLFQVQLSADEVIKSRLATVNLFLATFDPSPMHSTCTPFLNTLPRNWRGERSLVTCWPGQTDDALASFGISRELGQPLMLCQDLEACESRGNSSCCLCVSSRRQMLTPPLPLP